MDATPAMASDAARHPLRAHLLPALYDYHEDGQRIRTVLTRRGGGHCPPCLPRYSRKGRALIAKADRVTFRDR